MRQIPRLREAIDENDSEDIFAPTAEELNDVWNLWSQYAIWVSEGDATGAASAHIVEIRAVLAELKTQHPRRERAARIDYRLTAGSYYGVVDHVARWLHAYGYRAGMGVRAADMALDAYALDCGVAPHHLAASVAERERSRRIPNPHIAIGQVAHDPKTGKDRRLIRRAERGMFAGFEIWAVQDCVAHAGSPVPWDVERVFPWVVHVDTVVPCRDDGRPIKVTFSVPAGGPPGSPAWEAAELAAVKRAGIHEAMESFGFDPHQLGGDVAEWPATTGQYQAQRARLSMRQAEVERDLIKRLEAMGRDPAEVSDIPSRAANLLLEAAKALRRADPMEQHERPIALLHDAIDEIAARYKDRGIVGLRVLHRGREIELQVREPADPPWIAFINPADGDGYATDEDTLEGEGVGVFDALDAVSDKADAAEEDDGRHDEIEPESGDEFDQEQDPAAILADVEFESDDDEEGEG